MKNSSDNGATTFREKLLGYLGFLELDEEMGMIILDDEEAQERVIRMLRAEEMKESKTWKDLMKNFRSQESIFYVLDSELEKEVYDIIAQYYKRPGIIQIMDRESMTLETVQFRREETNFVIVTTEKNLHDVEKRFSLRDKIGLTERF